jgi:transketolase
MVAKGGYILAEAKSGKPDAIIMATGSELDIGMKAWEKLTADGVNVRLVSMPCCEWFEEQPQQYKDEVLPPTVTARVAIEAGIRQSWDRYLGFQGRFVGMSSFGASGPFNLLYKHFALTPENVVTQVTALLGK